MGQVIRGTPTVEILLPLIGAFGPSSGRASPRMADSEPQTLSPNTLIEDRRLPPSLVALLANLLREV